jgi:hypothetical protein
MALRALALLLISLLAIVSTGWKISSSAMPAFHYVGLLVNTRAMPSNGILTGGARSEDARSARFLSLDCEHGRHSGQLLERKTLRDTEQKLQNCFKLTVTRGFGRFFRVPARPALACVHFPRTAPNKHRTNRPAMPAKFLQPCNIQPLC